MTHPDTQPDIVERLRASMSFGGDLGHDMRDAADEITRLRAADSEAAEHVETVIAIRSRRFTGEPPYVGWKGLGLALREDYAELERLRAEVEALRHAGGMLSNCAFNLAQHPDEPLSKRAAETLDQCRKAWDAALKDRTNGR